MTKKQQDALIEEVANRFVAMVNEEVDFIRSYAYDTVPGYRQTYFPNEDEQSDN